MGRLTRLPGGPAPSIVATRVVGVAVAQGIGIDAHSLRPFRRGKGRRMARTKTAIIEMITTKFASDSWMNPQWM